MTNNADEFIKNVVKNNMKDDPQYAPYCMRCSGLQRMTRLDATRCVCRKCGARHEIQEETAPQN